MHFLCCIFAVLGGHLTDVRKYVQTNRFTVIRFDIKMLVIRALYDEAAIATCLYRKSINLTR